MKELLKTKAIEKVSFAWASTIIGSVGAVFVGEGKTWEGIGLILLALALEVVREYLKTKGITVKK